MSSALDDELSVVSYARLHGISRDHLREPLPKYHIEALEASVPKDLTDMTHLTSIEFPIDINTAENLTVDKAAAQLLQNANNGLSSPREIDHIISSLLDNQQHRKLQVETPLLRSDHASDMRYFAQENSRCQERFLPLEPLDDEMDTGLEWPSSLKSLPANLMNEFQLEKLGLTKKIMIYLQSMVKGSWREEDEEQILDIMVPCKKNTAYCPITPPLLPVSPSVTSYIPSSPACHLPLLSDPASLISEDLQMAEDAIFNDDTLIFSGKQGCSLLDSLDTVATYTHTKTPGILLPMDLLVANNSSPQPPLMKLEDCKVEVPLTPPEPLLTTSKSVTFCDIVEEMLLDPFHKEHRRGSLIFDPEDSFQTTFRDAADEARHSIEQEQLQEADSKSRVKVPFMNFSLPNPPWKQQTQKTNGDKRSIQRQILSAVQAENGLPTAWPGANKMEPKLKWTVFPIETAKAAHEETFGDEDTLHSFLERYKAPVMDSGGVTWKPPGFRILKSDDDDDDDDDIEIARFEIEQPQDISSLVKKRKMAYDEEDYIAGESATTAPATSSGKDIRIKNSNSEYRNIGNVRKKKLVKRRAMPNLLQNSNAGQENSLRREKSLFDGDLFSATDALDNFLEIRASKKQGPVHSAYFADRSELGKSSAPLKQELALQLGEPTRPSNQTLPTPSINPPLEPRPYIISSAIIKRRRLIQDLATLFPSAISIERDFTAHNSTAWLPNSITRSPVASSLATEADLIISPSTGIILSTLQKIKQKPLPGRKSKPAFKDRIEKVSTRYERLIVLVSEGYSEESTNGLSEIDTLALAETIGFCSSLNTSIIVQFVAGGEETLAKWLVVAMIQYGGQGAASVPLLEDETLWELFLRRAGFNGYAAQAVIAELKAPEGVDELGTTKAGLFGITAFVEMAQEERTKRFGGLLGGVKVLESVGRVLDAAWV